MERMELNSLLNGKLSPPDGKKMRNLQNLQLLSQPLNDFYENRYIYHILSQNRLKIFLVSFIVEKTLWPSG